MRKETDAKENSSFGLTPSAPWRIRSMTPLDGYCLSIECMNGLRGIADLSGLILEENSGVLAVLQDVHFFKQAYIDRGAVTWPGNLDLAPDAMYEAILETRKYFL